MLRPQENNENASFDAGEAQVKILKSSDCEFLFVVCDIICFWTGCPFGYEVANAQQIAITSVDFNAAKKKLSSLNVGGVLLASSKDLRNNDGTCFRFRSQMMPRKSIFSPVLAEILVRDFLCVLHI